MIRAQLDDEILTPSETLILVWFNTISANHVKLHAFANWGSDVVGEQESGSGLVRVLLFEFGA